MSTTEQSVSRQPHPVQAAIHTAIARLAGLKPTRIVGEPDSADAHGLVDDLLAVATIVDPIVAAIGDYADSTIGIPPDDRLLFAGQLRQALEGNATYVVMRAIERRIASRSDDTAEMRAAFRRSHQAETADG